MIKEACLPPRPTGPWLTAALVSAIALHDAASTGWRIRAEDPPPRGLATTAWDVEVVHLHDGRRLEGLVISPPTADDEVITFVQIIRPPGRPMHLVTWGRIAAERIRSIDRLPATEHTALAARIDAFRKQRNTNLAAEAAVKLSRATEQSPWRYDGRWFTLESSADAKLTRESVVRLEQVLDALETVVPPKAAPSRFVIRLCATTAEYRGVQDELGVRVDNPAFFIPEANLLVAGSDVPALVNQQKTAADALALAEQQLAERDRAFSESVRSLATTLEREGMPAAKRGEIVHRARSRWDREKAARIAEIAAARRENAARVAAARRLFHAWLAHEAWHAYADARLAGVERRLPAWLDEGLAQVIETAPLEAGELRLDAPDPDRLTALQDLLRGDSAPPIADVVRAGSKAFVIGHSAARADSDAAYLIAWGLALHVALLDPVLTPASLAALTARAPAAGDAVDQFEDLVGAPVDTFEGVWRARILALRPRSVLTPASEPERQPVPTPGVGPRAAPDR